MSTKAAFLDRDGVINEKAPEGAYITRWEDVVFLPGIAQAIAELKGAGFQVIVISNQRCVAKGLISIDELEALHERMRAWLRQQGAEIDAIYYCPHEKVPACECRKPEPGMLLQAAREHGVDLAQSWMIGDSRSDVEAGRRAGCKTVFLGDATTSAVSPDVAAPTLLLAIPHLLAG